jgi:WD40 repeat protein
LASSEVNGFVQIRDVATGKVNVAIPTVVDCHGWLRFTPGGRHLITYAGPSGDLRSWDAVTGAPGALSFNHRFARCCGAISPDGKTLVCAEYFGQRARLWNLRTGQELFALTLPQEEGFIDITFAPDNRTLAACTAERNGKAHVSVWRGAETNGRDW